MQPETKFRKGDSVTGVKGATRYRVETAHCDGSYTVRALFHIDDAGNDRPGFLGFKYRVCGEVLRPLAAQVSA